MSPRELIDRMLRESKRGTLAELEAAAGSTASRRSANPIISTGSLGRTANSASSRTGTTVPFRSPNKAGRSPRCRGCPTTGRRSRRPTRASVPPCHVAGARLPQFDLQRDALVAGAGKRPAVMIHPDDATALASPTAPVVLGNRRGLVRLHARLFDGLHRGVLLPSRSGRIPHFPMATVSTRLPAPIRSHPLAARLSTTTRCGSGGPSGRAACGLVARAVVNRHIWSRDRRRC